MRAAILVTSVVFVAWLVWHLAQGSAKTIGENQSAGEALAVMPTPMRLSSSEECAACHAEVVMEWKASWHAQAYTDPEVQRLSRGFEDKDCLPCHLPRPVLETGLDNRPLERDRRHSEGVDCFTCHFAPHAQSMVGAGPLGPAATGAPCQPQQASAISSMGLCAPCHNQHKVHEEWKQTSFAQAGPGAKDCNACHMPVVQRAGGRIGRSHRFPAAHDEAMLRTAATLEARRLEDGDIEIAVTNTGTGHNFPTDERHRAVDLELTFTLKDGSRVSKRLDRFRNPYRTEFELKNPLRTLGATRTFALDLGAVGEAAVHVVREAPVGHPPQTTVAYPESTQIPAGEARRFRMKLPSAVKAVHLRLYYRLQPFQPDAEATLLHEITLTLP
jgi:hypothetical protein